MNNFSKATLRMIVFMSASAISLVGCGASDTATVTAAPAPAAAPETVIAAVGSGDAKRGKLIFLQCRACHALDASEGHKVGPNLNSVLGAVVGSKEGFNYSPALTAAAEPWNEETLQAFLAKPSDYFPGTIMAFAGIPKPADRAAVVAYIKAEGGAK